MSKRAVFCILALRLMISGLFSSSCSNGGGRHSAASNVRVSDPATCSGPKGAFSHNYRIERKAPAFRHGDTSGN